MIRIVTSKGKSAQELLSRSSPLSEVKDKVEEIISTVRTRGDEALFEYCRRFDEADFTSLEVSPEEWAESIKQADPKLQAVMEEAAENIRIFHEKQRREGFTLKQENGVVVGQKVTPVLRAGLYAPGGTAAYYSTVLMNAVPAKVAGVKELILVTPFKGGRVNPDIMMAAKIAGVDRVFKLGGAQAVAALAFGTQTVPKVDCIVGPGNAYVAEAKRQVYGLVGIDMIAGPSEILIVADEDNSPEWLAADLLSQAEHDRDAAAVLITPSMMLAKAVAEELERQLKLLPREEMARASIDNNGKILVTETLDEAMELSNAWAPEHLELCVQSPFEWLDKVENAGSVFLGKGTPEPVGDYWAGTNHTLPTSGTARFASALSVEAFTKVTQFIYYPEEATAQAADKIAYFANREGLHAHAQSVLLRRKP